MFRLIQFLIFGHVHNWETTDHISLDGTRDGKVVSNGSRFILRCTKCGIVKSVDIL